MYDSLDDLGKAAFGLMGAFISAFLGSFTRHIYAEDGFKWRNVAFDLPVAMFCAIMAGGIGQYLDAPDMVISALGGALGYMGPHFIRQQITRLTAGKPEKDDAPKSE